MRDNQARFQALLCQFFQFDCADLDFGIQRIMNYKRVSWFSVKWNPDAAR